MFFIRWWLDDDRRGWMKSNWFDLALVVLLSSPVLRMLVALRVAGLAPALKIGALIRANRQRLLKLIVISGESLPGALALVFGIVFFFGASVFGLEHGHNPQFAELQDGLWWAFVTLTTVGYGDIVPVTSGGRMVAVITMVFGIAVYSLSIANLTAFIARTKVAAAEASAKKDQSEN
jgi:voltage-gated potassium channel